MNKFLNHMISTERLEIVPFSEDFISERYLSWLHDKEVVKFSDQRFRDHTLESCSAYLASFKDSPHLFWAICEKKANYGHIGNMNAYIDMNHFTADIGILLGEKKIWEHGYGTEAWTGVCRFLFSELNIRKITAGTLEVNNGMINVMKRSGMVEDGRRSKQCLFEGLEVDMVYYAIYNKAWNYYKGLRD